MAPSTPQSPLMSPKPGRGTEALPPAPPALLVLPVPVPAPPAPPVPLELLVASAPPPDPLVALADAAVVPVDAGSLEQAIPEIASERRRSKADEAGRRIVMVAPS